MTPAVQAHPVRRRAPCRVLLADDHDVSRDAVRMVLEFFGFPVTEARTGLEALALAQAGHPRIVLLDIVLPEIDGQQLARMLRADPATRDTALVALTALSGPDDRATAMAAGCDEFLTKPVSPLRLVEVVRSYARGTTPPAYDLDPLERDFQNWRYRGTTTSSLCASSE